MQRTKRAQQKRKKIFLRKTGGIFLLSILLLTSVIFMAVGISKIPALTIRDYMVFPDPTGVILKEDIVRLVDTLLEEKKYFIFENNFAYLFNLSRLVDEIKEKNIYIEGAYIDWHWFNQIDISIIERTPKISWCNSTTCFVSDDDGTLFREKLEDEILTIYLNSPLLIGEIAIEKNQLSFINNLITFFEENNIEIAKIEILDTTGYRGHIEVTLGNGLILYINGDIGTYSTTRAIYLTLFDVFGINGEIDSTALNRLEYIDFRFGEKINYKYRE